MSRAFSLVETALALGIVSFALVGLVALLPMGLTSFRSAIDTSVATQIFQRVTVDAEQTDFDTLLEQAQQKTAEFYVLPTRYFDESGNEIVVPAGQTPSAEQALRIIYHARLRGTVPGAADVAQHSSAHPTSLPSTGSQTRFNPRDTTFLTVQVVNNPGGREIDADERLLWDQKAAARLSIPMSTYNAVIARNSYKRL
jgi:uncharacterized protein (TIGR02598 family)